MEMIYDHVKLGVWWAAKGLVAQIVFRKCTHLGSIIEIYIMHFCSFIEQTLPPLTKKKLEFVK